MAKPNSNVSFRILPFSKTWGRGYSLIQNIQPPILQRRLATMQLRSFLETVRHRWTHQSSMAQNRPIRIRKSSNPHSRVFYHATGYREKSVVGKTGVLNVRNFWKMKMFNRCAKTNEEILDLADSIHCCGGFAL